MHTSNHLLSTKNILSIGSAIALAAALVIGLLAATVNASSVVGVSSNIADVAEGDDLVLTVTAQNDGDVHELEVDHSLEGVAGLPEFSVYADEADPTGGDAGFAALGVNVEYSDAANRWVIDFGPTVTQTIRDNGGMIDFYLVLRDADGNILWGSMDAVTPENTFGYDLVEGTGDSLVEEVSEEDAEADAPATPAADDVVIPGVPNTSVAL